MDETTKTTKTEQLKKIGIISGIAIGAIALITGIILSRGGMVVEDPQLTNDSKVEIDKPTNTTSQNPAVLATKTISSKRSTILELANANSVIALVGSTGATDTVFDNTAIAQSREEIEKLSTALGEIEALMAELSESTLLSDETVKPKYDKFLEISAKVLPALKDIVVQGWLLNDVAEEMLGSSMTGLVNGDIDATSLSLSALSGYMTEMRAIFAPLAASSNKTVVDFQRDIEAVFSSMLSYMETIMSGAITDYAEVMDGYTEVMDQATALSTKYIEPDLGIEYFFGVSEGDVASFFDAVDDLLSALETADIANTTA